MARRTLRAVALAVLGSALLAPSALAHAGNPNFESLVEGVTPSIPGFSVTVLNGDDRLEVINHSTKSITIYGYNKEPYLRMDPNGTVAVNIKSPAYYLNNDPTDTAPVPKFADPTAPPQWKVIEHDGRYQFHDHRIHWMAASTPPAVKNKSKRTKVDDWRVPLTTGGKSGAIAGTLFWRGSSGGPPAGAFIALVVILLLGGASVVVVRRRRAEAEDDGDGGGDGDPGPGAGGGGGRPPKVATAGGSRKEAW
ncbi:MAG TPA: hypothetical protein VHZ31_02385 [Solirubrobacteraceae bacterium]|jgi:hypothetical protein|nr:hypothetical protein [Solirubrobacteraceae bacterium]